MTVIPPRMRKPVWIASLMIQIDRGLRRVLGL